jgi:hypothetical protein
MPEYRWIPMLGAFEIAPDRLVFNGRRVRVAPPMESGAGQTEAAPETGAESATSPQMGIVLCNQQMVTGSVSATIRFEAASSLSLCHIIVSYDPVSKATICAGLGWGTSMFSVIEWLPPALAPSGSGGGAPASGAGGNWVPVATSGDRVNLRSGVSYHVVVSVRGSTVTIDVEDIRVLTAVVPSLPSQSRQLGVFCFDEHDIVISEFAADVSRPQVFVVTQCSAPSDDVYSEVIKKVCDSAEVEAVRGDEIYGPGIIIKDVVDRIARSQVVIADVSPANPNVYFEVGYALALRKPIILLAQRRGADSPLPFDISSFRVLFYDDSIGGKAKLETGLRGHLREILGDRRSEARVVT